MLIDQTMFNRFSEKQEELDAKIYANNNLGDGPSPGWIRLHYFVEAYEAVMELKGDIKYWSIKPPRLPEFLEEYIDALHFLASYSNYFKRNGGHDNYLRLKKCYENKSYQKNLHIWKLADMATIKPNVPAAVNDLNVYISFTYLTFIAERLGFTSEDVIAAYDKKYAENHKRSDSGVY